MEGHKKGTDPIDVTPNPSATLAEHLPRPGSPRRVGPAQFASQGPVFPMFSAPQGVYRREPWSVPTMGEICYRAKDQSNNSTASST